MRANLSLIVSLIFAVSLPAAITPDDLLPSAPPWSSMSEGLIAPPTDLWITPAEASGFAETPGYDPTVAWLKRLCDASPWLELRTFGRTPQGRELVVVVASKQPALTPAGLRQGNRPILLVQAGIHSGEIDGKDAGMMLLRDIAFRGRAELLDRASLLFVPALNADGHERSSPWSRPNQRGPRHQGWRTTAQNLNLNRDFIKADAPETRALLRLLNEWQPSLYLDVHVTDGIDYQYDITFGYNGDEGVHAGSPRIADWLNQRFRPAVSDALRAAGHIPGPLIFAANDRDLGGGLSSGPAGPRFSQGYGDLRHLPSVLVENHSLKPFRQRVLGTRVLLESTLRVLGTQATELQAAILADQAARPETLPANWRYGEGAERVWTNFLGIECEEYASAATGGTEVRWTGRLRTSDVRVRGAAPGVTLSRPRAYWVPASEPEIIERLRWHGVRFELQDQPRTLTVEMYRLLDPKPAAVPFEGRHPVVTGVKRERREERFPAGSVRVSTDQPLGDLAVLMLEPESHDSLLAWGLCPGILQRTEYIEGYVVAPLAEQMMAANPALRSEFDATLAADPAFAASPEARRRWFYERSPFYDSRYLLYPVGIER